jgi:uncharacterized protein (TIGR02217 family)
MIDPVVFPFPTKRLAGVTRWQTDIQQGVNGNEVRNADWQDALRRFDARFGVTRAPDQRALEAWHFVCQGAAIGFLLRDEKDYQVTETNLYGAHNTWTQGHMQPVGAPSETATVFQLVKTYNNGYRQRYRTITRPQAGTVQIYNTSFLLQGGGYSVDYTKGRVTFTAPPGANWYWRGNFYVPCRFEADEIPWDLIRYKLSTGAGVGELPEIGIVEVRE